MKVELSPQAVKYIKHLNEPAKSRIIMALENLSQEPPQGDIKSLAGQESYRLRVGGYRILFKITDDIIKVHAIATRGQAYKGGR